MAKNEKAEQLIIKFFETKMLSILTKSTAIYEHEIKKLGLFDRVDLLMALELGFLEYQRNQNNAELVKQKNGYK